MAVVVVEVVVVVVVAVVVVNASSSTSTRPLTGTSGAPHGIRSGEKSCGLPR